MIEDTDYFLHLGRYIPDLFHHDENWQLLHDNFCHRTVVDYFYDKSWVCDETVLEIMSKDRMAKISQGYDPYYSLPNHTFESKSSYYKNLFPVMQFIAQRITEFKDHRYDDLVIQNNWDTYNIQHIVKILSMIRGEDKAVFVRPSSTTMVWKSNRGLRTVHFINYYSLRTFRECFDGIHNVFWEVGKGDDQYMPIDYFSSHAAEDLLQEDDHKFIFANETGFTNKRLPVATFCAHYIDMESRHIVKECRYLWHQLHTYDAKGHDNRSKYDNDFYGQYNNYIPYNFTEHAYSLVSNSTFKDRIAGVHPSNPLTNEAITALNKKRELVNSQHSRKRTVYTPAPAHIAKLWAEGENK